VVDGLESHGSTSGGHLAPSSVVAPVVAASAGTVLTPLVPWLSMERALRSVRLSCGDTTPFLRSGTDLNPLNSSHRCVATVDNRRRGAFSGLDGRRAALGDPDTPAAPQHHQYLSKSTPSPRSRGPRRLVSVANMRRPSAVLLHPAFYHFQKKICNLVLGANVVGAIPLHICKLTFIGGARGTAPTSLAPSYWTTALKTLAPRKGSF
jgi:hypothetical protein